MSGPPDTAHVRSLSCNLLMLLCSVCVAILILRARAHRHGVTVSLIGWTLLAQTTTGLALVTTMLPVDLGPGT